MDCDSLQDGFDPTALNGKNAAAILLVIASFVVLYHQVISELVQDWLRDGNYSHGFLIVPLALYFAWERRYSFAGTYSRPSSAAFLLIIFAVIATVLNMHSFVDRIAMLICVMGGLAFIHGWARMKVMAFPIAFLLLMIPIPAILFNPVAFPLQLLSSRFGEWTLVACQVPVFREGNVIHLANTSLEVAEACSGIRSLISLLSLAIVYGYFTESRIWVRIVLALSSVPVAIVANAFRVAGTGLAAHYRGADVAEGFFHSFSGWLVFLAAFAMLFVLHRILSYIKPAAKKNAADPAEANDSGRSDR
jgi:exosortase